jgi:hypothetical protein
MIALWRVNLALAFNRSLSKRNYALINVLKAWASVISMCKLHVAYLSNITPRYFALFTNKISRPFKVKRNSGGRRKREK